jgi:Na+-transporting NADH:ubiquinone oxidoreductase subunit NqrA
MFCSHLVKAFTHLQIKKVPSHYILKRYTRNARHQLMWDSNDIVTVGPDCTTEQFRTSKLVTLAMAVVRACRMSRTTFDAGCERLEELRILAENILSDIGPSAQGAGEVAHLKMGNQYQPMHEMRLKAWWFQ